jgi:hypothetical protein
VLLTLVCAAAGQAQTPDPVLRLTEPQEWRGGGTVTVAAGATVRVRGVASHPGGVARVLVAGQEATLRPDPEFPELVNFEAVVEARQAGPVVMRIVPRTGQPFERQFPLQLSQAPAAPAARPATPERAQSLSNPWGGFRLRGALYAAAAVGGVVLAMKETTKTSESCRPVTGGIDCFLRTETSAPTQSAGFALVGVAVGGLILDAVLTSKRARGAAGGQGGGDDGAAASLRLEAPATEVAGDHVRVHWIRLRF